jgi:hypothetical protein
MCGIPSSTLATQKALGGMGMSVWTNKFYFGYNLILTYDLFTILDRFPKELTAVATVCIRCRNIPVGQKALNA